MAIDRSSLTAPAPPRPLEGRPALQVAPAPTGGEPGVATGPGHRWMRALADRYALERAAHPGDSLAVVFDIDGTIVDLRHHMRHVLLWFDREEGSEWFVDLLAEDIDVHENRIDELLDRRRLPTGVRERAATFYRERFWDADAVLAAHRPYQGVLEIIRWFQLQRDTVVALNTGRPERLRAETLRSLNALGKEYRVQFDDELLFMNPGDWEEEVRAAKVAALVALRERGHRIVAVVDNEPANLHAMASADDPLDGPGPLLLHADTLYESQRRPLDRLVDGVDYDVTDFVHQPLPRHVQLAWTGLASPDAVDRFLDAPVGWGAIAVDADPLGRPVVVPDAPSARHGEPTPLAAWLRRFNRADRSVRLELLAGGELVDRVLEQLDRHLVTDHRLWFSAGVDVVHEAGFERLRAAHPAATLSCPIDFLAPLIVGAPEHARDVLGLFRSWGLTRFSVAWGLPGRREVLDRVEAWGHEVDITGVDDLRAFLGAALLVPRSITARLDPATWPSARPLLPA